MARKPQQKRRIDTTLSVEVYELLKTNAPSKRDGGVGAWLEGAILSRALDEGDLRAAELKERFLKESLKAVEAQISALNLQAAEYRRQLSEVEAIKRSMSAVVERRKNLLSDIEALISEALESITAGAFHKVEPEKVRYAVPYGKRKRDGWNQYDPSEVTEAAFKLLSRNYSGRLSLIYKRSIKTAAPITPDDVRAIFDDRAAPHIRDAVNARNLAAIKTFKARVERNGCDVDQLETVGVPIK